MKPFVIPGIPNTMNPDADIWRPAAIDLPPVDPGRALYMHLRELRPELAGFMQCLKRGNASPQEYKVVERRLLHLLEAGVMEEYPEVGPSVQSLLQHVQDGGTGEVPKDIISALMDASLHALTFKGPVPQTPTAMRLSSTGRKPRLLVADDDRIVREMMQQLFGENSELYTAADGREAWTLIELHHPDLVILDDIMPGMTGLKLIESLRASPSLHGVAVLMLTGSDQPQSIARAMQAGAAGYLTKPVDLHMLVQKVHAMIQSIIA